MSRSLHLPVYRGDPLLLILGLALISIGLVAIASASIEYSDFHFGNPWHHTERHALYLMAGFAAGGLAYCLPTDHVTATVSMVTVCCFCVIDFGAHARHRSRGTWGPALAPPRSSHCSPRSSPSWLCCFMPRAIGSAGRGGETSLGWSRAPHWHSVRGRFSSASGARFWHHGHYCRHGCRHDVSGGCTIDLRADATAVRRIGLVALALTAPYRLQRLTAYQDPWADPSAPVFSSSSR